MRKFGMTKAAFMVAALFSATAANADVLDFSGSMTAIASVAPDASCAPLPFRGTILPLNTVGHSIFGDFTYSHSNCLAGGVGAVTGSFLFDFGVDQFNGTLDGFASATGTPGVFDQLFNYTVLGGTGRFFGATGAFTGVGTVDVRVPPPQVNFAFEGLINAPAVPEPGSWAMMLLGFGLMGMAIRRRSSAATFPQCA